MIRKDPDRLKVQQDKDRERKKSDRENPDKEEQQKMYDRESKRKLRNDPFKCHKMKSNDTESRKRAKLDFDRGLNLKSINRRSKERSRKDPEKCPHLTSIDRDSKKRLRSDPVKGPILQSIDTASKKRARQNPEVASKNRESASEGMTKMRERRKKDMNKENEFPPTITDEIIKTCIDEFREATSEKKLKVYTCAVCGIDSPETRDVEISKLPCRTLLEPKHGELLLPEYDHFGLILHSGGIRDSKATCCKECLRCLERGKLPACSLANGLQIGTTPSELTDLKIGEKLLIAKVRPSIQIIKFREICGAGSELRGIKGNTISFHQDISTIATKVNTLPHKIDDLCEHMKVIFVGSRKPSKKQLQNVLEVRRHKVQSALKWLKKNNPLYKDVKISDTRMKKIPIRNIPHCIWATLVHDEDIKSEIKAKKNYTTATIDDIMSEPKENIKQEDQCGIIMEESGIIDVEGSAISSKEQTMAAAEHLLKDNSQKENKNNEKIHIIPHGSEPLSEYRNPNLWTGAYPWLFPYGQGGPECERQVQLSIKSWIKHLLQLHNASFRTDQKFMFHVFNIIQKREVSLQASICVRHPKFGELSSALSNITSEQLQTSLIALADGKLTDPDVKMLMNQIHVIGARVNGTPYSKRVHRLEIQGMMMNLGMPCFWVTLNPAEVHSPIVSFLSGHEINIDNQFPEVPSSHERAKNVASHPVECAKYFDVMIKAFIECLLRYKKPNGGILGNVSGFYGCTEEQGRGALHLHMLVWLEGYKSPTKMHEEMKTNSQFKTRVLKFLEGIIQQQSPFHTYPNDAEHVKNDTISSKVSNHSSTERTTHESTIETEDMLPDKNDHPLRRSFSAKNTNPTAETTFDQQKLHDHLITCPDQAKIEGNKEKILTQGVPDTKSVIFDKEMDIRAHMLVEHCCIHHHNSTCYKYNNKADQPCTCRFDYPRALIKETVYEDEEICVKRWNPWVNNYERTTLVCMKCNHDIKFVGSGKDSNASAYYMCDYQTKNGMSTHNTLPIVMSTIKKMEIGNKDKYSDSITRSRNMIVKCVNKLTSEREMSGPHVASLLLGGEDKYCSHHFRTLNILSFLSLIDDKDGDNSLEVQSRFQSDDRGIILLNDVCDYMHRGEALSDLSLYKYTSCIEKITSNSEEHLKGYDDINGRKGRKKGKRYQFDERHPQHKSHLQRDRYKQLVPRLTWFPPSAANDIEKFAKCVLLLFKPFTNISELKGENMTWEEALNQWIPDEEHQQLIDNMKEMHLGQIRKRQLDEERHAEQGYESDEDDEYTEIDGNFYFALDEEDSDYEDIAELSYHSCNNDEENSLDEQTLEGLEILARVGDEQMIGQEKSSLVKVSKSVQKPTIKEWKDTMTKCKKMITCTEKQNEQVYNLTEQNTNNIEDIGSNSIHVNQLQDILDDVSTKFSLNQKQRKAFYLVGENVMKRYNGFATEQILLYLGGAGGTGKTRVIEALVYLHEKLNMKFALKLAAFTGTAASNIGGRTLSSLAQVGNHTTRNRTNTKRLEETWKDVRLLIIDEVSMVSCPLLARLHQNLIKGKHDQITAPFANMDILFVGDFHQFPPVKSIPLYYGTDQNTPTRPLCNQRDVDREFGRSLWMQLTHTIILREQNRIQDETYADILSRLATGTCTVKDFQLLNTRIIGKVDINTKKFCDAPVIVPGNNLRREVNRLFAKKAASASGQHMIFSIAKDFSAKYDLPPSKLIRLQKLSYTETGNLPGELELFIGMPVVLTMNLAVEAKLSNGSMGNITKIVCKRKPVIVEGRYILPELPSYVVVKFSEFNSVSFKDLEPGEVPIFPQTASFTYKFPGTVKSTTLRRHQIPLIPCYAYTSYKAQGKTLPAIITDLIPPPGFKKIDASFAYVPLSRVRRLDDLAIMRPFPISVIQHLPPEDLVAQDKRFEEMDACL